MPQEAHVPDEPDLAGLEAERARLYADLGRVGDFRRGALNAVRRKCGPPMVAPSSRTWPSALKPRLRKTPPLTLMRLALRAEPFGFRFLNVPPFALRSPPMVAPCSRTSPSATNLLWISSLAFNSRVIKTLPSILARSAFKAYPSGSLNVPPLASRLPPMAAPTRRISHSAANLRRSKTLPPTLMRSAFRAVSFLVPSEFKTFPHGFLNVPPVASRLPPIVAPSSRTSPAALKPLLRKTLPATLTPSALRAFPFDLLNVPPSASRLPPTIAPSSRTSPSAMNSFCTLPSAFSSCFIKTLPPILAPSALKALPLRFLNVPPSALRSPPMVAPSSRTSPSAWKPPFRKISPSNLSPSASIARGQLPFRLSRGIFAYSKSTSRSTRQLNRARGKSTLVKLRSRSPVIRAP